MKHFLVACSAALALMATTEQKASAWSKWNFNIGMNISHEAAENNCLWGLFRNGPYPFAGGGGGFGGPAYGGFDGHAGGFAPQGYAQGGMEVPYPAPASMPRASSTS